MVVKFEFSKDFKTWFDKVNEKSVEDFTVLGSYDVRQGYNLTDVPRVSTLTMDVVSEYELGKALIEYKYIRVFKNSEMVFIGQLSEESERKIETLTQQVLTIKYVHLLKMIEDVVLPQDFQIIADAPIPLMEAGNDSCLVNILVNWLFQDQPVPFEFDNEYTILDKKTNSPLMVIDFDEKKGTNIWTLLNDLLRVYGYIFRLQDLVLKVVDILKKGDEEGIELLDGADISVQTHDVKRVIPNIQYSYAQRETVILYQGAFNASSFLWIGTKKDTLSLDYKETENKQMQSVSHLRWLIEIAPPDVDENGNEVGKRPDVWLKKLTLKSDKRSVEREARVSHIGTINWPCVETVIGDVTYRVYDYTAQNPENIPEGFVYDKNENLQPKYLYTKDQVERYANTLVAIKNFERATWTFYSRVKLPVDTIVRFKDIPDSTCRIFEVKDTLQGDEGYTYSAFPYYDTGVTFKTVEEYPEPIINEVTSIEATEPITVYNGKYKKDAWRIDIHTRTLQDIPKVQINSIKVETKWDSSRGVYYIEISLKDTGLEYLYVNVLLAGYEYTANIPVYKTDNRPVIIQYKYSTSSINPDDIDTFLAYGDSRICYADYMLGFSSGELWSEQIPTGSQYEGMYLWKRTWNYNISEWVYEMLTTIVKTLEVSMSPSVYPISKRNMVGTDILIKVIAKGYPINDVEVFSDAVGGVVTKSPVYESQWNLLLPATISQEKVRVWATVDGVEAEAYLSGIVADDLPIYWGKIAEPPKDAVFVEGDYYLTMENIPMRWDGYAWKELEKVDSNYSEIIERVMADAFSDESQVIPAQSVIWQYVRNLMVNDATVDNLIARNLKVEDKLKKFKTEIKGEDATEAVFDVQYEGKTIFKIVPETGNIFFGEPLNKNTPKNGFMYEAGTGRLRSANNNVVIDSSGIMTTNSLIANNASVVEGNFSGDFQCNSLKTSYSSIKIDSLNIDTVSNEQASDAYNLYVGYQNTGKLKRGRKYRCRLPEGNPDVFYVQFDYSNPASREEDWLISFFDERLVSVAHGLPMNKYSEVTNPWFDSSAYNNILSRRTSNFFGQVSWNGWYCTKKFKIELLVGGQILILDVPIAPSYEELQNMALGQIYTSESGAVFRNIYGK